MQDMPFASADPFRMHLMFPLTARVPLYYLLTACRNFSYLRILMLRVACDVAKSVTTFLATKGDPTLRVTTMLQTLPLDIIILIAGHFDCKDSTWALGRFRLVSRTLCELLSPFFFRRVYIRTAPCDTANDGQATKFLRAVENSRNARHVEHLVFNAVADDQNLSINEILPLLPGLRTLIFASFTKSHFLPINAPFSLTRLTYTHIGVPIDVSKVYTFLRTQTSIEHLELDIDMDHRRALPAAFLTLPNLRILYGSLSHIYPVLTGASSNLSHLWVYGFEGEIAERAIANSNRLQSITFLKCDGMDDTMPALFASLLSNCSWIFLCDTIHSTKHWNISFKRVGLLGLEAFAST